MKRLLLKVPEALQFEDLTEEQQAAIQAVFGQWVMPMPGTKAFGGFKIVDAITLDTFDSVALVELALPFEILALWGEGSIDLDETEFLKFLQDQIEYDEEGGILNTTPPVFHIPHTWAGW